MKENRDPWYIRLPDGRILKAKSTDAVRHHLEAGHIPRNSYARRDPSEEWVALTWIQEFGSEEHPATPSAPVERSPQLSGSSADVNLRTGVSSRLDPMRLQTVGVRGFVDELLAALDSTLNRSKLWTACLTGIAVALAIFLIPWAVLQAWAEGGWLGWALACATGASLLAYGVTLITRQTHLELSTMRPAESAEARRGMQPFFVRLFVAYLVIGGVGYGLVLLFQRLPIWLQNSGLEGHVLTAVSTLAWIVGTIMVLAIFAVLINVTLLVAPILVVEEGSVADALREGRALFREHRLRIFLYEGMALAMGIVATLPLALPVWLALTYGPPLAGYPPVVGAIATALVGLAAGPLIACLAVANVFVYLNLRYEYTPSK